VDVIEVFVAGGNQHYFITRDWIRISLDVLS
jgi:hypothetical protein